jgi:GNAT superfamily N-acetyltransferase
VHWPADLEGFIASVDDKHVGLATLEVRDRECEVVTLNSSQPGLGVGSALLAAVEHHARERGCHRLWLVTTNDNTNALHFYQVRGLRITAWRRNAISDARRLKPEIPLVSADGIVISDEFELAKQLT